MNKNKFIILDKIKRYCPICEKFHVVELVEFETLSLIKGQKIMHKDIMYFCNNQNEVFETVNMCDRNLVNVTEIYIKYKNKGTR